jgi:thioredoxin reductase (NADPH)
MYDAIIIGAGTAGMTAAIYLRRAGKKVLIFERENTGGQIVYTPKIENYPAIASIGGADYAERLFAQTESQGAEFEFDEVLSIQKDETPSISTSDSSQKKEEIHEKPTFFTNSPPDSPLKKDETTDKPTFFVHSASKTYAAKSIIIASGVKHRRLGLARENEFSGEGLSYCAVCDGAFFKGKDVAVVGGGSTALTDALFLSNTSKKVYLIHRRGEFRGERRLVKSLHEKENVEFILDSEIKELLGANIPNKEPLNANTLTAIGISYKKNDADSEIKEFTDANTLSAIKIFNKKTLKESILEIKGLFVAVGFIPSNAIFQNLVALDGDGYIIAEEDCKTSETGIFAAGDCRTKEVRQLATAAADGAVAALAACKYLA